MTETTKTFKLARNKGNARIWIESSNLLTNGRAHGERFAYIVGADAIRFTFAQDDAGFETVRGLVREIAPTASGVGRIAGTATRPIIDVCNRKLSAFFGDATAYAVTFLANGLEIRKAVL